MESSEETSSNIIENDFTLSILKVGDRNAESTVTNHPVIFPSKSTENLTEITESEINEFNTTKSFKATVSTQHTIYPKTTPGTGELAATAIYIENETSHSTPTITQQPGHITTIPVIFPKKSDDSESDTNSVISTEPQPVEISSIPSECIDKKKSNSGDEEFTLSSSEYIDDKNRQEKEPEKSFAEVTQMKQKPEKEDKSECCCYKLCCFGCLY